MKAKASESKHSRSTSGSARRPARKTIASMAALTITFRHIEPTPALHAYAERKLNHVAARLKRACSIHLILTIEKYRHQGEVTVRSGRFAMTAREETKDLYAVIDLLADKIGRQLKSNLARIETRRMRTPSAGEILAAAEDLQATRESMTMPGRVVSER
jgi:ribosomal subunit interface protein